VQGPALSPACTPGVLLAMGRGVAIRKRTAALGLISLTLLFPVSLASAQPPGLVPPGGHLPTQHAVPPIPYALPSPMPTLPPPSRNAPLEPTIGFGLGTGKFRADVRADGSIHFESESGGAWAGFDPVAGLIALVTFDTTDAAMHAVREDPYLAEKLRLMEDTFEARVAMRRAWDEMVMQRALDDLPRYLDSVWRQRAWSPATRRRVLFALWDEAAEEGDGNELVAEGGAEARRLIEEFIAYRIPPGSRDGFRRYEIVRLNRIRQSRRSFSPYAAVADRRAREEEMETTRAAAAQLVAAVRTF
jgi:hypothetical protein